MNKDVWDERCGRGILGLVLACLVFTPLAFAGVGPWEFLVVQALTIGVMALWVVRLWVSPKPQFLGPPIVWAVLAFALYAVGRYLTADIEYEARLEFIRVVVFTVLFLAILNHLYPQDRVKIISYTLIILGMALSSYAVMQYLGHANRVWNVPAPQPGRASGTFMSPDHFCAFVAMILPLALALLLAGRIQPLVRVLLGYSILVMLGGVAVTFSRAGWAATVAGLLVVLVILTGHRRHRKFALLILALLAGGGTWFVTRFLSRTLTYMEHVANPQGGLNLDVFVRTKLWTAGLRMWRDHFWWGVGPGLFDSRFNEYRPQTVQLQAGWVHCDYLNLLTDWGLVGGLIVLAGIGLCLAGLGRSWRRVRRSEADFGNPYSNRFAFFLGALGGLTAVALHVWVDFDLHVPADALVAATLLALLSSNLRFATERYWHNLRWPAQCLGTLVLATAMIWLGWQEYRLANQARWIARAAARPNYTLPQARALEAAFAYEPGNFENAARIGEGYRLAALNDPTNAPALLDTARRWFQRGEKLNPHYSLSYLGQARTLDDLDRPDEAEPFYVAAETHDPNGAFTAAIFGWHYLQVRNYTAARIWLLRAAYLHHTEDPFITQCLQVAERELAINAGSQH
jgi:O-antigen ligase